MKRGILIAFIIVSFLGFLDASYLTLEHFLNRIPPCGFSGCETVTTSMYSTVFGIPVALLGAVYYFLMFAGAILVWQTKNGSYFNLLSWTTVAGLLASLWFVYAQTFILHAFCVYCIFSALTSTTLFILGMVNLRRSAIGEKV